MANTIILKRSSQAAKVPVVSDLTDGELALNYTDGRIYYRHSSNAVAEINAADARTLGGLQPSQLLRNDASGTLNGNLTVTGDLSAAGATFSGQVQGSSFATSGSVTAGSLTGDGAGLTALNGSNITTGTVAFARLPTGTTSATVAVGNHNHSTLYVALTGAQTISGLKTFSNGFSDGFITFLSAQINRASGNIELQYNRSASSEGVVIFGNTVRACRFVASTGNLGLATTTPAEKLDVVGNIKASGFVRVGTYTVETLPSASTAGAGAIIYVSNATGGSILAFSDGTNWRRSDDRAIIAAV